MSIGTPAERVARGVAWLDAIVPEWWKKVELRQFDIEARCNCVLGQIFTDHSDDTGFDWAVQRYHLGEDDADGYNEIEAMGFDFICRSEEEVGALQSEWFKSIAERQRGGP
jgi:hypothetical protein